MGKRRVLNRERVIEKAAELADAAGTLDALSLTALAAALNVRVPSLYNHIRDLEDLRHALGLYGLRELLARLRAATSAQGGIEALMVHANAYRQFAREHPGIYSLTLRAADADDEPRRQLAVELVQHFVLLLGSMGIHGDDAIHALRGFRALLHGFVALETGGGYGIDLDLSDSFRRVVSAYLNGIVAAGAAPRAE